MSILLSKLANLLGPPKAENQADLLADLSSMLRPYSEETQRAAYLMLSKTMTRRAWPMPAEIIAACEACRKNEVPPATQDKPRRKLGKEALRGPIGQHAMRDGWLRGLWEFICRHDRLPTQHEQHDLMRNARHIKEEYGKVLNQLAEPESPHKPLKAPLLAALKDGCEQRFKVEDQLAAYVMEAS